MAREKICGAYVLTHVQSGHLYIGSTGDLHGRKGSHVIALRNGVHKNKRLQALGVTFDQVRRRTQSPNYPTWLRKPSEGK